jgi:glycosyltransferase involved in cell wall biosynthesis
MKVVINALWRATTPSGICRHTAALARCLCTRPEIERVFVVLGSWQTQYFTEALQLGHSKLTVTAIHIANRLYARNLWYLYGLPKIAEDLGPDIVHSSFPIPLNRHNMRAAVVITLHDLYPYDCPANFGLLSALGHRMLLRQCLQHSDRVACVSDFTLSRLAAVFGTEMRRKAVRIHNCVEPLNNREQRPRLHNLDGHPFLLCVAQHRRNKNIELLLKGFAMMLAEGILGKDTRLLIVGGAGPETPTIVRTIATLAIQANVILAHGVTDAELAWLYKNTRLSLCTSTIEGFGLPLAESIRLGARVVCSDIPAFREIGGDSCTFFPLCGSNPVESFVWACECALQEPLRCISHSCLYSSETIATQYMAVYSDLLRVRLPQAA